MKVGDLVKLNRDAPLSVSIFGPPRGPFYKNDVGIIVEGPFGANKDFFYCVFINGVQEKFFANFLEII